MFLFLITWFIILLNSLTIFLLTKLKIYSDFFFLLPSDIHLYMTSEECYFT